jgi:hypothetical protein
MSWVHINIPFGKVMHNDGKFAVAWLAATLKFYCSHESSFLCQNNSGKKLITAYYNDIAFLHSLKVLKLLCTKPKLNPKCHI